MLWVIPGADLVVVHRADTDHGRGVDGKDLQALVDSILAARRGEPDPKPDLRPLQPTAFSSQLPPVAIPRYRALPKSVLDDYVGNYALAPAATDSGNLAQTPGGTVRVFLFDDKPYIEWPGGREAQMFPTDRDTFTIRVGRGVGIAFERRAEGQVTAVTVTLGKGALRAVRAQQP